MKKALQFTLTAGFCISQSYGFDGIATSIAMFDTEAVPILDNTGTPIVNGTGYVAVGTFSSAPTLDNILTAFTPFGDETPVPFGNTFNADGFFDASFSTSIPLGTTGPPVGEQAYVVLANSSTLEGSDLFAVLTLGSEFTFEAENEFGNGEVTQSFTSGNISDSIVIGQELSNVVIVDLATFTSGVQLVGVPEPSSALLSLVGLAFIARRRR